MTLVPYVKPVRPSTFELVALRNYLFELVKDPKVFKEIDVDPLNMSSLISFWRRHCGGKPYIECEKVVDEVVPVDMTKVKPDVAKENARDRTRKELERAIVEVVGTLHIPRLLMVHDVLRGFGVDQAFKLYVALQMNYIHGCIDAELLTFDNFFIIRDVTHGLKWALYKKYDIVETSMPEELRELEDELHSQVAASVSLQTSILYCVTKSFNFEPVTGFPLMTSYETAFISMKRKRVGVFPGVSPPVVVSGEEFKKLGYKVKFEW